MQTRSINILSDEVLNNADAICFTSNGIVKSNNRLVMGAGIALAFNERFPGIDTFFGKLVKQYGNMPFLCSCYERNWDVSDDLDIINFPTKNHFSKPADINLIRASAVRLRGMADQFNMKSVYIPAPGIGLGGLSWNVVKEVIEPIFDDRFIITFKPKTK